MCRIYSINTHCKHKQNCNLLYGQKNETPGVPVCSCLRPLPCLGVLRLIWWDSSRFMILWLQGPVVATPVLDRLKVLLSPVLPPSRSDLAQGPNRLGFELTTTFRSITWTTEPPIVLPSLAESKWTERTKWKNLSMVHEVFSLWCPWANNLPNTHRTCPAWPDTSHLTLIFFLPTSDTHTFTFKSVYVCTLGRHA